jgi:hypothetical protein
MKVTIVTTITTTLDLNTMAKKHTIDIDDQDNVSEISRDVFGALVLSGLTSAVDTAAIEFPRAAAVAANAAAEVGR